MLANLTLITMECKFLQECKFHKECKLSCKFHKECIHFITIRYYTNTF